MCHATCLEPNVCAMGCDLVGDGVTIGHCFGLALVRCCLGYEAARMGWGRVRTSLPHVPQTAAFRSPALAPCQANSNSVDPLDVANMNSTPWRTQLRLVRITYNLSSPSWLHCVWSSPLSLPLPSSCPARCLQQHSATLHASGHRVRADQKFDDCRIHSWFGASTGG